MRFITRLILLCLITWVVMPSGWVLAEEGEPLNTLSIPGYGASILSDSGFEYVDDDTKWNKYSKVSEAAEGIQIVESPVSSGTKAYRITEEDLPHTWDISGIAQFAPIRPDEWYTLNADVFVQALELEEDQENSIYPYRSLFTIKIRFFDENFQEMPLEFKYLDVDYPSAGYITEHISGISPTDARYAMVELHLKARTDGGGGTVYVDNVELVYDWAPRFLHHTGKTDKSIDLAWTPPSDMSAFSEYEIHMYNDVVETTDVIETTVVGTTQEPKYTVTGLSPTTAYTFTVKAKTSAGYVSIPTHEWRVATAAEDGFTTIMPIGDSMTQGYEVVGGYRYPLVNALANANLKVDFVGSHNDNAPETMTDREHQGHPGDRADHIVNIVDQQVVVYEPDIVLLFAGTNDMFNDEQARSAHEDMDLILSKITSKLPNTRVIVSTITRLPVNSLLYDPHVVAYNKQIVNIVQKYQSLGNKVGLVDMHPLITEEFFPPIDEKNDKIHPNIDGFNKMATVWYDAIHAVMTSKQGELGDIEAKNPTAPTNLQYALDDNNNAILNWNPSTDNVGVQAYKVKVNNVVSTVTEAVYTTINLKSDTPYAIKVTAVDAAGNESGSSNEIYIARLDGEPGHDVQTPLAPSALLATKLTKSTISLKWKDATDNIGVTEYLLYMNGNYYGSVTEAVYMVDNLSPGTKYAFKVTAKDARGNESAPSNSILVTTALVDPDLSLKQPTGLVAGAITATSVELIWNASLDPIGVTYYTVYVDGERHQENITSTTYKVTGLEPNTSYEFTVSAIDDRGIASPSSNKFTYSTDVAPNESNGDGGNDGRNVSIFPIITLEDKRVYTETAEGTKLLFVPNEQKAIDSINSDNQAVLIDILEDKPFEQLEIELSGKLLALANNKNKSIIIKFGEFSLQLPPGFIEADEKDNVLLNVKVSPNITDEEWKEKSLKAISPAYDLMLTVNGKVVSSFNKSLKLTLTPEQEGNMALSNIFVFDPVTSTWIPVGGRFTESGTISVSLSHFSQYVLLESSKTFDDIMNHWAKSDIEALAAKQIVSGMTSNLFDPNGDVTRAQFASMLARALHLEADSKISIPFTDVPEDSWYYSSVKSAYQAQIISGISTDKFAPNERITREQMAVMIVNAYLYDRGESKDTFNVKASELPYKDAEVISHWALPYVRIASDLRLIMGADGQFSPVDYADRSQSAAIINRLLKLPIE